MFVKCIDCGMKIAELSEILSVKGCSKQLSTFLAALLLFVAINVVILVCSGEMPLSARLPSSLSKLNERYSSQVEAPAVTLLGSSLMRAPFHACDEELYGRIDYVNFSEARTLSKQLSCMDGQITVFNLARDGAMVTDSLLLEEKLLRGKLIPKLIVYGIAPRDFVDCMLENERATESFSYLFDFWDAIKYGDIYSSNWLERFELVLTQSFPLFSSRNALQDAFMSLLKLDPVGDRVRAAQSAVGEEQRNTERVLKITRALRGDCRGEALLLSQQTKNGAIINNAVGETTDWMASLWQYSLRYLVIDQKRFERELNAFGHILEIAKERNIRVLVLNMPLSPANLALLPEGFYKSYLIRTQAICKQQSADYFDLQVDRQFTRSCYRDVAHLNAKGGRLLIERISPLILQVLEEKYFPATGKRS